jgi:hypothetical protein
LSKEQVNKAVVKGDVGRWFTEFWDPTCNLGFADVLAAPDMLLSYSLLDPSRGHQGFRNFVTGFGEAFPVPC